MKARRSALQHGRSLLPVGVTAVEGTFERGDTDSNASTPIGREVARGIVNYEFRRVWRVLRPSIIRDRSDFRLHLRR